MHIDRWNSKFMSTLSSDLWYQVLVIIIAVNIVFAIPQHF